MRKFFKRLRRSESGQGMTEYIIIVALIAVAAIGVVTIFGDNIRALFGGATDALAGDTNVKVQSEKASSRHTKTRTLKNFAADNKGSNR